AYRSKLLQEGSLSTNAILFEPGSAKLKTDSYDVIKDISTVLIEKPSINIKIIGHTDSDGDENMNLKLSNDRSIAVKEVMQNNYGIENNRIITEGKGENEPVTENNSEE